MFESSTVGWVQVSRGNYGSRSLVQAVSDSDVTGLCEDMMMVERDRVYEHGMTARDKKAEEGKSWSGIVREVWLEGRHETRSQGVCLHVMDSQKRDVPCGGKAFGGVETNHEISPHAWASGDGDEVGLSSGGQGAKVAKSFLD